MDGEADEEHGGHDEGSPCTDNHVEMGDDVRPGIVLYDFLSELNVALAPGALGLLDMVKERQGNDSKEEVAMTVMITSTLYAQDEHANAPEHPHARRPQREHGQLLCAL